MSSFRVIALFFSITLFTLIFGYGLLWPRSAWGQTQSTSGVDILDRERRQEPPEPLSQPRVVVTEDDMGQPQFDDGVKFTLDSVIIEDNTCFSQEELLASFGSLMGQSVTFGQIKHMTDEMTKKYHEAGYILSRVLLPAQEVDQYGAVIRLAVIEGFVSKIIWQGDEALIQDVSVYFSDSEANIIAVKPLKYSILERQLLLLSDVPGLEVTTTFKQSQEPKGSDLYITVTRKVFEASLGINNNGTRSAGPWMSSAGLYLNSIPEIGSQSSLNYAQALDYHEYYAATFNQMFQWVNGFSLSASYTYSESQKPDTEFARLFDYATESHTGNLQLKYPVLRGRNKNLSLEVSYTHRNSKTELLSQPYTRDRYRAIAYRVNFDYSDEYGGVTQIVPSFTQGLDIFNATDKDFESSNPLAPARYNRANLYISRNQRLFGGLSLFFSGEIQLAGTILPPYEQFSLGGAQFGRGYESGVLEGDNGVAGLFELRYIGKLSESLSLQPYLFLDGGTVWNKGDIYNFDPHADLSSAGFGFRLYGTPKTYLSSFNFNILLGKPLKTVNGKSSPRFVMLTSMTF